MVVMLVVMSSPCSNVQSFLGGFFRTRRHHLEFLITEPYVADQGRGRIRGKPFGHIKERPEFVEIDSVNAGFFGIQPRCGVCSEVTEFTVFDSLPVPVDHISRNF